jgi:hypothetical protein
VRQQAAELRYPRSKPEKFDFLLLYVCRRSVAFDGEGDGVAAEAEGGDAALQIATLELVRKIAALPPPNE